MVDGNIVQDFISAIQPPEQNTDNVYSAVVSRIDDEGVVWVKIVGSDLETPTALSATEVKAGDMVNVQWRNNKLYIATNVSNPSAGLSRVVSAEQAANEAWAWADSAHQAADEAWDWADNAHEAADEAWNQANRATGYANDALAQLGVVEEVVDVLSWISEHGTYKKSTDTAVVEHKMYFTLTGTVVVPETYDDNTKKITNLESYYEKVNNVYVKTADTTYNPSKTYYTVSAELIANPTGSPTNQNYYEIFSIDKAVQNYISSHLALTDSGLWVVKDNQGYKVLLANDGLRIYDNGGHLVSTFGENITFDAERPQRIGNDTTYVKFYDSNNDRVADKIEIKGDVTIDSSVTIGGMPTNVSDLYNDVGYQTASDVSTAVSTGVSGKADKGTAVKSTVTLYYRSTTNSTPSINSQTSIGTSASTDNAWEYVMPQPKSGRYFYTCEKYTYADNTVGFSTVRSLDNATYTSKWCSASDNTYIDGGKIYAHSVTADQLDATNINASNSLSIGALTTATQNDILNSKISIGGKNLLRGTGDYYGCSFPSSDALTYYNWADNGEAQICKYVAYTSDLVWDAITFRPFISYSSVRGKTVTLSFWYQSDSWSNNDGGHNYIIPALCLYTAHRGVSRHKWHSDYSGTAIPTTSWKKYEATYEITDAFFDSSAEGAVVSANDLFTLQLYRHNKSVLQIKKVKLEIGNKATDWTPAPEDLSSFTGENILMDTNAPSLAAISAPAARYFSDVGQTNVDCSIVAISDAPIANVSYGAKFVITAQAGVTTGGRCLAFYSATGVKLTRHRVYTLSCWAKGTGNIRFQVGNGDPYYNNLSNGAYGGASTYSLSSSGWVKVQWSFYYDNQWSGTYPIIYYGVWGNAAGTVYLCGFKLEEGNAAASWAMNTTEAGKTATNYITEIDTRKGITIKPADSSGNDYVQLNSTDLRFVRNGNARTILQDDWMCLGNSAGARITLSTANDNPYIFMGDENNVQMFRASSSGVTVGAAGANHTVVSSSGLTVYTGTESDSTNVANFGSTIRIGKPNAGHIEINDTNMNFYNNATMFGRIRKGSYDRQMQIGTWKSDYTYSSFSLYGDDGRAVLTVQDGTSSSDKWASLTMTSTAGSFTLGSDTSSGGTTYDAVLQLTTSKLALYYGGVTDSDIKFSVVPSTGKLTLEGHNSAVGTVITASQTSSRSSGTDLGNLTNGYIDVPAGSWVITLDCRGDLNSSGKRLQFELYNSTDSTEYTSTRTTLHTSSTATVGGQCTLAIAITAQKRFYCRCYQNSGSAVDLTANFRAVRIS